MDSDRSAKNESANPSTDSQDKFATKHEPVNSAAPMALLLKSAGNQPIPFGRYEILRVLGEGAMGSVYLARDTQLERQVAIKVPKLDDGDRGDLHRFYREARTMATLRHPHLCPVFDVGEIGGVHFFTMAYIEGGTLVDYLTEDVGLPDRQVARLIAKTASALDAAHKAGIIHRDLKPANIMIDRNKEPVVMDFGLAGVAGAKARLTQWGDMLGTPAYMAPEQIRGDLDLVGPPSDVYSLGAIMYQMLTGRLPFDGSIATVVRKALGTEPAELTSLSDHVDDDLSAICHQAMSKDPRARFATASEMANALRDFLLGTNRAPAAQPPTGPTPSTGTTASTDTALLDQHAACVRELWGEARYADALPILETLAQRTDAPSARYAAWAREEIPKVREKIKQAERGVDWLSTASAATSTYLGPPVHHLPRGTSDSLPPWLAWAMAAPVVVILFLIVLVFATRWNSFHVAQTTAAITPSGPTEVEPNAKLPTVNDPADQAAAAGSNSGRSSAATSNANGPDSSGSNSVGTPTAPQPVPSENGTFTLPPALTPVGQASPSTEESDPPNPSPPYPEENGPSFPARDGPPLGRPPPRDAAGILRDLDDNKDGQLTTNEIPPDHRRHLMRADTNDDKILTRAELEAFHPRPKPPPPRPAPR